MTVKELRETLAHFPDGMEVRICKPCLGGGYYAHPIDEVMADHEMSRLAIWIDADDGYGKTFRIRMREIQRG